MRSKMIKGSGMPIIQSNKPLNITLTSLPAALAALVFGGDKSLGAGKVPKTAKL